MTGSGEREGGTNGRGWVTRGSKLPDGFKALATIARALGKTSVCLPLAAIGRLQRIRLT